MMPEGLNLKGLSLCVLSLYVFSLYLGVLLAMMPFRALTLSLTRDEETCYFFWLCTSRQVLLSTKPLQKLNPYKN
jgi:hypothetical protein